MSDELPPPNLDLPPKRRRRWWVRLIHPIGWTFWLVSMPLFWVINLWVICFCPWVPSFDFGFEVGSRWVGVNHYVWKDEFLLGVDRVEVSGDVVVGPFMIERSRRTYMGSGTLGWKFTTEEPLVTGFQYGWVDYNKYDSPQFFVVAWLSE